ITSPPELASPNDGEVLVAAEIDVFCTVQRSLEPGASDVDMSSVRIELLDGDNHALESVMAGPTGTPDEYSGHVILTQVEDNGRIGFRCVANDLSIPALTGTNTV